ncbi:hypothetical protein L6452_32928 [Arctium lappa]|uniref:Uncharacterized protein n=1 Tax=Arctium lappa TaxID=4217 RepID=A0ACB8Z6C5_ARCLA|nr:hypothetical protein L6452_32928 [Arctium lappa]
MGVGCVALVCICRPFATPPKGILLLDSFHHSVLLCLGFYNSISRNSISKSLSTMPSRSGKYVKSVDRLNDAVYIEIQIPASKISTFISGRFSCHFYINGHAKPPKFEGLISVMNRELCWKRGFWKTGENTVTRNMEDYEEEVEAYWILLTCGSSETKGLG